MRKKNDESVCYILNNNIIFGNLEKIEENQERKLI